MTVWQEIIQDMNDKKVIDIIVKKCSWFTICSALCLAQVDIVGFPNTSCDEDIKDYLHWLAKENRVCFDRFISNCEYIIKGV